MIQQLKHNQIQASPLNPRKHLDADQLDELAESILQEGLLQNLVVRPTGDQFEIAAGERRWRAIGQLIAAGQVSEDFPVPVVVRDLTDLQLLQLATTENMARASMSPLEEARAFQQMLEFGSDVDTIAAETGLTLRTVKQRLALVERLTETAQEALATGQLNLGQAQALTATNTAFQDNLVGGLREGERLDVNAGRIASLFRQDAPAVSVARFPLEQYSGTFTKPNIFSDDSEDRFDDVEQFRKLQAAAAERLLAEAQRSWAWARIERHFSSWRFEQLPEDSDYDPSKLGVIIQFNDSWGDGSITIHERLQKPKPEQLAGSDKPAAEVDPAALTAKHKDAIYAVRTRALQSAIRETSIRKLHITLILGLLPGVGLAGTFNGPYGKLKDTCEGIKVDVRDLENVAPLTAAAMRDAGQHAWDNMPDGQAILQELLQLEDHALENLVLTLTAWSVMFSGTRKAVDIALWHLLDAEEHLPDYADLGTEYLELYRPARLRQVSQAVLGFDGEGKTKKELVALIDAAQSPDVPAELLLEDEKA